MAIGRITGPMLQSNLERQGIDIAIDGNLVYADVTNHRVGIFNSFPGYTLDVNGNARLANLYVLGNTITSDTGRISFGSNANVVITGGTNLNVLYTDGSGNLSWANVISLLGLGTGLYGNTIVLGSNSAGSLSNALTLSTTTTVTDAIAKVNQLLGNITDSTGTVIHTGNITTSNANIQSTTNSSSIDTGALTVAGGVGIGGNLTIGGNLNLLGNISGGISSGTHIPASANILYVAKNGNDSNDGSINAPFLTIKAAMAAATNGVSVHVAPGTYTEANPITIPAGVSLMGDNLRNIFVIPQTPSADFFYLTNNCYVWGITIKDYTANGFSYSSSTSSQNVFVSPYIQNLTSSTTTGTAVMIDGNYTSSISTKAMIVGFFTIINKGGYGVHITNSGYSQLVNIYTIATEVGVWCESGAFCTLNGSDNSIGNVGLRADGHGPLLTYGNSYGYSTNGRFLIRDMPVQPHVNQVVQINGDPNFYSIDTISHYDALTWEVIIQETYTANLAPLSNITFYQRSAVVASAHTFEYVGAGTNPATALPQYGGIPNANLEVIQTGGGRVTYTATDHKGNFKIGSNLVINQGTGTISGTSFDISLFAKMTPYILALEG